MASHSAAVSHISKFDNKHFALRRKIIVIKKKEIRCDAKTFSAFSKDPEAYLFQKVTKTHLAFLVSSSLHHTVCECPLAQKQNGSAACLQGRLYHHWPQRDLARRWSGLTSLSRSVLISFPP